VGGVTGKHLKVGYGDREGKTRPHLVPLPYLDKPHSLACDPLLLVGYLLPFFRLKFEILGVLWVRVVGRFNMANMDAR